MKIRDHAQGHWPQIVSHLLGDEVANTRKHGPCPSTGECGKGSPRFRFADKFGNGNFFCHCSDGDKDGFDLLMCARGYGFADAARDVEMVIGKCPKDGTELEERPMSYAEELHRRAFKIVRSGYLESRGLELAPGLRWAQDVKYWDDGREVGLYHAMLAPVMRGREFVTYHATYLEKGRKAALDPCRKLLPGLGGNQGCACPLYPSAEHMGIAEGVETAIAAKMLTGIPTWAALNTALMGSWDPPESAKVITIFADHDANFAGHAAAYKLAHRLAKKGFQVDVRFPDQVGTDWNDVLLDQKAAA